MLVLSRKIGERVLIGDSIVVTVVDTHGGGVRLGFDAPAAVEILREEIQAHEIRLTRNRLKRPRGPGCSRTEGGSTG